MDSYDLLLMQEIEDIHARISANEDFCLTVDDDEEDISSINFATTIDLGLPQDFC